VQPVDHQSTHRRNAFNKNGPAQAKQQLQWEAPSKPLTVDNPPLLPEQEVLQKSA